MAPLPVTVLRVQPTPSSPERRRRTPSFQTVNSPPASPTYASTSSAARGTAEEADQLHPYGVNEPLLPRSAHDESESLPSTSGKSCGKLCRRSGLLCFSLLGCGILAAVMRGGTWVPLTPASAPTTATSSSVPAESRHAAVVAEVSTPRKLPETLTLAVEASANANAGGGGGTPALWRRELHVRLLPAVAALAASAPATPGTTATAAVLHAAAAPRDSTSALISALIIGHAGCTGELIRRDDSLFQGRLSCGLVAPPAASTVAGMAGRSAIADAWGGARVGQGLGKVLAAAGGGKSLPQSRVLPRDFPPPWIGRSFLCNGSTPSPLSLLTRLDDS